MSRTRMTTQPFLLLALSYFVMSDSGYPLISCPFIFFMILGRNVEQDQMTCRVPRMAPLPFLLLELSPFVLFEIDFSSAL